jgi:hypothetical protein
MAFGQKKVFNQDFSIPEKTPLFISYYANLGLHAGVKGGLEYSLYFKEKTKEKKRKIKTIRKNLILAPSVAFYSHKKSHKGLLISADLIWRRYTKRLYISDISVGLGHFTKFNYGSTYEITPSGIKESKRTSRSYISPSFSYAFGKRFNVKEAIPTELFLKTNINTLLGYNSKVSLELSLEVGLRMSLKYGIKQKINTNNLK